jgi:hypothetical protein
MSTYDTIQQTIYAITYARRYIDAEFHQAVRGWGNVETYHSDQWKIKGEKLLELQLLYQAQLDKINNENARKVLDAMA